jgi:hypothetical protein
MKLFVGYSIWNKVDMVVWLLDGIVRYFDPNQVELGFVFDTCEDDSVDVFHTSKDWWLVRNGFKFQVETWDRTLRAVSTGEQSWLKPFETSAPIREVGGHNRLLKMFLASDCDMAVIAQDDQQFARPVYADYLGLDEKYGDRLGIVGGRDGYFQFFRDMASSKWSESSSHERLAYGEFRERPFFNSGPVGYPRKLVETIGLLDDQFTAYYVWDDYGARARAAGFQSVILSTHVIHAKFGRTKATVFTDASAADIARLRSKHGGVM